MSAPRPSGATLTVLKTFESKDDFEAQLYRTRAVPLHIALEVTPVSERAYQMPLVTSVVPAAAFYELAATFQALWALGDPAAPTSRQAYHGYVQSREFAAATPSRSRVLGEPLLIRAKEQTDALFPAIANFSSVAEYTHGDATLSNCVFTDAGVRLIDFSPRPAPPEAELDIAKLRFSSLGFDTDSARGILLDAAMKGLHRVRSCRERLVNYYLATHVVRVLSKEPPATLERVNFYQKVIDHVSQKA